MREDLESGWDRDRRVLTRGLASLHRALRSGDVAAVRETALQLDRGVGPHLRFEAESFLPRLRDSLGRREVERLLAAHRAGQQLVVRLADEATLDETEGPRILQELRRLVDVVTRCGSLLERFVRDRPTEAAALSAELEAGRENPVRWRDVDFGAGRSAASR